MPADRDPQSEQVEFSSARNKKGEMFRRQCLAASMGAALRPPPRGYILLLSTPDIQHEIIISVIYSIAFPGAAGSRKARPAVRSGAAEPRHSRSRRWESGPKIKAAISGGLVTQTPYQLISGYPIHASAPRYFSRCARCSPSAMPPVPGIWRNCARCPGAPARRCCIPS